MTSKDVDTQEHYEVSWSDDGNRRHQLASNLAGAQEVARGFIGDHGLSDVQIHKVTTTRKAVPVNEK